MTKPPFYKSVIFSLKGLVWMIKNERNFQLELLGLLINLFMIVFLKLKPTDTALILILCSSVLVAEILNTAVEKLCDFAEPDFNEKIGIIKDVAAGAVLLATLFAVIVGGLIYWPYLENMLSSKLSLAA